jgi:hypothetical protein
VFYTPYNLFYKVGDRLLIDVYNILINIKETSKEV